MDRFVSNSASPIITDTFRKQRMSLHLLMESGLRAPVHLRQQTPVSSLERHSSSVGDMSHCSVLKPSHQSILILDDFPLGSFFDCKICSDHFMYKK